MEGLRLFPDAEQGGEGFLSPAKSRAELVECTDLRVGGLTNGTVEGRPTVIIATVNPDGQVCVVETTLALFLTAADGLKAKHGDPRDE